MIEIVQMVNSIGLNILLSLGGLVFFRFIKCKFCPYVTIYPKCGFRVLAILILSYVLNGSIVFGYLSRESRLCVLIPLCLFYVMGLFIFSILEIKDSPKNKKELK